MAKRVEFVRLCLGPARVLTEARAIPTRKGERLGIGAVQNHRRDRIKAVGEIAAVVMIFGLLGEQIGECILRKRVGAEHHCMSARPPDHLQCDNGVVGEHRQNDRRPLGGGGGGARELLQFLRGGIAVRLGGQGETLGVALETCRHRAAVAVVPENHNRPCATEDMAEIVGDGVAHLAGADDRPKCRFVVGHGVAVGGRHDGNNSALRIDKARSDRRGGEHRTDGHQGVAGHDVAGAVAGAVVGAVVVVERNRDARCPSLRIGLFNRQVDGIHDRAAIVVASSGERGRDGNLELRDL